MYRCMFNMYKQPLCSSVAVSRFGLSSADARAHLSKVDFNSIINKEVDAKPKSEVSSTKSESQSPTREPPVAETSNSKTPKPANNTSSKSPDCSKPSLSSSSSAGESKQQQQRSSTTTPTRLNKRKVRGNSGRPKVATQKSHEQPDYVGFKFRTDEEILNFVLTDDRPSSQDSAQQSKAKMNDKRKKQQIRSVKAPITSSLSSSSKQQPRRSSAAMPVSVRREAYPEESTSNQQRAASIVNHHPQPAETSEQQPIASPVVGGMRKIDEKNVHRVVCDEDLFNYNEVVAYLLQSWQEVQQLLDSGSADVVLYSPPAEAVSLEQ